MSRLLHVNASPRGSASDSLTIATAFLDAYGESSPASKIDTLELFETALPEFGSVAAAAKLTAFSGVEPTGEQAEAWDQARSVFDHFAAADSYLFNVPMWNAGVPYILKQWIDLVTQPGWAFSFDPVRGYTGLITGKKAVVVYTSAVYSPGVPIEFGVDFQSTFFNDWLRFVGISDVTEIFLSGTALSAAFDTDRQRALDTARALAAEFDGEDAK